jgi:probable rRNA maturation factor
VDAPVIHVQNRQRKVKFDVRWLRRFARSALSKALRQAGDDHGVLREAAEIEVAIVSDRVIATVHRRFMSIDGATDVITFQHGEIVISADTARGCAEQRKHSVEEELALYTVHGLLHLNGFDDHSPGDRTRMHAAQSRIVRACLAELPPP